MQIFAKSGNSLLGIVSSTIKWINFVQMRRIIHKCFNSPPLSSTIIANQNFYSPMLLIYCAETNHLKEDDLKSEYNILLMELFTTKLIGLELQESKLEANFTAIGLFLNQLKDQVSMLVAQQGMAETRFNQSKQQLDAVIKKTNRHHVLLLQHEKSINQLNAQSSELQQFQEDIDQPSLIPPSQVAINNQIVQPISPNVCSKQIETTGKQKISQKNVPRRGQAGVNKKFIDLVQRVEALEKQNMQIYGALSEDRISKQALESLAKVQKRQDIVVNINQKRKKESIKLPSRKRLLIQEGQKETIKTIQPQQSRGDISGNLAEVKATGFEQAEELKKELELLKQAFTQKTRIIDASVKECQQKMQSFDKNMDLIERSHEMLKYDFQRTSTSFSKSRTPFTESQGSKTAYKEGRKQTKASSRDYYEERIMELFHEMDTIRSEYLQIRSQFDRQPSEKDKQQVPINYQMNSSNPGESDLKRQIITCKTALKRLREEFQDFAAKSNSGMQVRTVLIKPNENKQDWKSLSTKMQKLKMQLQGSVRELQGKIISNNEMVVQINEVLVGIEQCKLLLKKKVDTADYQRSIKKLESRITSFIFQICEKSGKQNQIDAALAKHPWFCLSCDSQLKNYTGKSTKINVIPEKLKGGKVNPEIHMVRRNQNGKLPSVIK